MEPCLYRRRIVFKCGAEMDIISRSEADLDEEEAIRLQQNCFKCKIEDGTITDEDLDILAISMVYDRVRGELREEHDARVSQPRVN